MSRAFVKEDDLSQPGAELPERSQSPHPNYVTTEGLAELAESLESLVAQRDAASRETDAFTAEEHLRAIDRNLRYAKARIACAILIDAAKQPAEEVAFGARVRVRDPEGEEKIFTIVGEDEADAGCGKTSWVSPLARALRGAQVDDSVTWKRPAGDLVLEVVSIDYSK